MKRWLCLLILLALPPTALGQRRNATETTGLAFTADGKTLIAVGLDGNLRFIDVARQKEVACIEAHKRGIYGLARSADGRRFATAGGDHLVRLWDVAKMKELRTFEGNEKEVWAVALSPDSKYVASGGADRTVRIWDAEKAKELHVLRGHGGGVSAVAFSPDSALLASGSVAPAVLPGIQGLTQGDKIRLWNPATAKEVRVLEQRGHVVAFSPNGTVLASAGMYVTATPKAGAINLGGGSRIAFWDLARGRELPAVSEYWHALAFTADGRYFATGWGSSLHLSGMIYTSNDKNKGIHLWETTSRQEVLRFSVPKTEATVLAISPDGRRLAAGTDKGGVRFLELAPEGWHADLARASDDAAVRKRWEALAGEDAAAAYEAIWTLAAASERALPLLKNDVKPVAPAAERIRKLIDDLDHDQFEARDAAANALGKLGSAIEPDLRQALEKKSSLEFHRRAEALLDAMGRYPATPDERRRSRAIAVLERIGTAPARELLTSLSKGVSAAGLTREASAALRRLERLEH